MNNKTILNILFILASVSLLIFLLRAPEESTAILPHDDDHAPFFPMGKKEAEKHCQSCHNDDGVPFPTNHPSKNRCLFCHKKTKIKSEN